MAVVADGAEKDGKELFRELLTVYPGACYEDYYKNGTWQADIVKIDLDLIKAHRKEAGAPEPIPIEDVVMPQLPVAKPPVMAMAAGGMAGVLKPGVMQMSLPKPAPAVQKMAQATAGISASAPTPLKKPLMKPIIKPVVAGAGTAGVGVGAAGGPSAELRQIALFIQRWKLEAAKAKLLLARLTPLKRRWVMSNFKGTGSLEQYIQQCDRTMAWEQSPPPKVGEANAIAPKAAVKPGAAAAPLRPVKPAAKITAAPKPGVLPAGGLKRPLMASTPSVDPKRLKTGLGLNPGAAKAAPKPALGAGSSHWVSSARSGLAQARPAAAPAKGGTTWPGKPGGGKGYATGGTSTLSGSGSPVGGMRPAVKPPVAKPVAKPTYSSGKVGGYGAPPKAMGPARPGPVGAKPGGYLRPGVAKPGGPPKAKASGRGQQTSSGSLIRSLLHAA